MPRGAGSELVRVEVLLPQNLADAARKEAGGRGLSPFIAEVLAKRLKVKYQKPRVGRPKGD